MLRSTSISLRRAGTAMLEDCRPRVVIADETPARGRAEGRHACLLRLPRWGSANGSRTDPGAATSTAASLGYVVFTSGSTGRRRASRSDTRRSRTSSRGIARRFGLTPKDRMPMLAGLGFDATVLDAWSILCTGDRSTCRRKTSASSRRPLARLDGRAGAHGRFLPDDPRGSADRDGVAREHEAARAPGRWRSLAASASRGSAPSSS